MDIERTIVTAMARAMFVDNWADQEEEEGRCYPGQELMDVAPETPEDYLLAAYRLAGHFEALNKMALVCLAFKAFVADGLATYEEDNLWEQISDDILQEFGHYLYMRARGHGVCWEDDHADCGIVYPHFEYYP